MRIWFQRCKSNCFEHSHCLNRRVQPLIKKTIDQPQPRKRVSVSISYDHNKASSGIAKAIKVDSAQDSLRYYQRIEGGGIDAVTYLDSFRAKERDRNMRCLVSRGSATKERKKATTSISRVSRVSRDYTLLRLEPVHQNILL